MRQGHAPARHDGGLAADFAVDFVKGRDLPDDARRDLEDHAASGGGGKLERTEGGQPQLQRLTGRPAGRTRGKPAGLRNQFDQDDGGHDWKTGKVAVEIEIGGPCPSDAQCAFAGNELHYFVDQAHRRLVRQQVQIVHARILTGNVRSWLAERLIPSAARFLDRRTPAVPQS